jgi:hypothetical protein
VKPVTQRLEFICRVPPPLFVAVWNRRRRTPPPPSPARDASQCCAAGPQFRNHRGTERDAISSRSLRSSLIGACHARAEQAFVHAL